MKKYLLFLTVGVIFFTQRTTVQAGLLFPDDEAYAVVVEKPAAPVGGMESITKKISYPQEAELKKITGKVYLLVYVNEKGEVDDVKVVKGIGSGCDEAAVSAIRKCKFTPAEDKGVAVKAKLSMPIQFKL
jgi:periplasmic protein TonB